MDTDVCKLQSCSYCLLSKQPINYDFNGIFSRRCTQTKMQLNRSKMVSKTNGGYGT